MEVLPAVLSFLPRYARFPDCPVLTVLQPTTRHKGVTVDQPTRVDHREGVGPSPFDNNYNEMRSRMRVYLEREKVGSCRLHLRGRLQRLCKFQSLPLLSSLRSDHFNCSSLDVVDLFFVCFFAIEQYSPQRCQNGDDKSGGCGF